jgi:hypothetical protein
MRLVPSNNFLLHCTYSLCTLTLLHYNGSGPTYKDDICLLFLFLLLLLVGPAKFRPGRGRRPIGGYESEQNIYRHGFLSLLVHWHSQLACNLPRCHCKRFACKISAILNMYKQFYERVHTVYTLYTLL